MRLAKCFLIASLLLVMTVGCGEDNSNAVEAVEIVPKSGTWIGPETQFTVRFNTPIIPSSGSITFGNYTFKLPYPDPSDTITWNRCFAFIPYGEQAQLIVHDFQDVTGHIQAEAFHASYPVFIVDPGPAEIIGHQPSGSRVDPITTRGIRITLSRPVNRVEFQIVPPLNGTLQIDNDRIQCESVANWNFLTRRAITT